MNPAEPDGPLFLCADLGTSSLKAALIGSAGGLCSHVRIPYGGGENSRGAYSWLAAFSAALKAFAGLPAPAALVISGSGPTLVPVTKDGETLRPLYWYDPPFRREGTSSFFLPKAKAFMERFPAAGVRFFFSPQEWLSWKLGAEPVTVLPHAGYEPYYWDAPQCRELGLDPGLFPPFVNMGRITGKTGTLLELLPPGIPIAAGAPDFIAALIGTGTLEPGRACDRTGSSEGINVCAGEKPAGPIPGVRVLPHVFDGLWNLGAVIGQSGKLLDDYRAAAGEAGPYSKLVEDILDSPSHPGRKALDAIGDAFLAALDSLRAAGADPPELVLSGGQCRSPRWNQYKAGISGKILRVPEITDAELAGNAVLAAAALDGGNLREKAAVMIRIKESYYP